MDSHTQNKLYQVSLLQGLTNGDYHGSVTVGELKRHGDVGIGTFDRLNGELILLDGEVYRATGDGRIEAPADSETTPFAISSFMTADEKLTLKDVTSADVLFDKLNKTVEKNGKNRFFTVRIDGLFGKITARSICAQNEPYRRLVDVLETDQTVFNYENTEGTLVGLYCPAYMSSLNAVGWHLHFISRDRTKGGHLLDAQFTEATSSWSFIDAFEVVLPRNEPFASFDLSIDQSRDIEKVEKNK